MSELFDTSLSGAPSEMFNLRRPGPIGGEFAASGNPGFIPQPPPNNPFQGWGGSPMPSFSPFDLFGSVGEKNFGQPSAMGTGLQGVNKGGTEPLSPPYIGYHGGEPLPIGKGGTEPFSPPYIGYHGGEPLPLGSVAPAPWSFSGPGGGGLIEGKGGGLGTEGGPFPPYPGYHGGEPLPTENVGPFPPYIGYHGGEPLPNQPPEMAFNPRTGQMETISRTQAGPSGADQGWQPNSTYYSGTAPSPLGGSQLQPGPSSQGDLLGYLKQAAALSNLLGRGYNFSQQASLPLRAPTGSGIQGATPTASPGIDEFNPLLQPLHGMLTGGGAEGLGGMSDFLSNPDAMRALFTGAEGPLSGIDPANYSLGGTSLDASGLGGGGGGLDFGGMFGTAATGLGGVNNLLGLIQAFQGGNVNPLSVGQNLYGLYNAVNALGNFGGPTLSSLTGIAGLSGGLALPIAAFTQMLTAAITQAEERNARASGWWNNPIKGGLYSGATSGVERAQGISDALSGAPGGIAGMSTDMLLRALPDMTNSLAPYYRTAQGGLGAIRASDTVTGGTGDMRNQPYTGDGASPEQYTANFTRAQTGMTDLVKTLLGRGVSYEQLGQLPVTGDWADGSMDMANPLQDFYTRGNVGGRYDAEAAQLWGGAGADIAPQDLLTDALGSAQAAPESVTKASHLLTDMYGGPLWTALARMGVGGPEIQGLIQQNFDPWAVARTWDAPPPSTYRPYMPEVAPAP